jgi:hypothetical protein
VSIRSLRARLERLQARAGAHCVIGQDRDRDRERRQELRRFKLSPGLTDAQTAELAALDASFENEDRDRSHGRKLFYKQLVAHFGGPALTDGERKELAELRDRYPPDPENSRFRERDRKLAALFGAIAETTTGDAGRTNSKPNDSKPQR